VLEERFNLINFRLKIEVLVSPRRNPLPGRELAEHGPEPIDSLAVLGLGYLRQAGESIRSSRRRCCGV
jgi:hypothetical protein